MKILEVSGLTKFFGGLSALNDVSFNLAKGEILGIIGPNGSGKSTLFNVISGVYKASSGEVVFNNKNITNMSSDKIARTGIGRTFQANVVYKDMTVLENMMLGHHLKVNSGLFRQFLSSTSYLEEESEIKHKCEEILEIFDLIEFKNIDTKNLPHGHQRSLGIAIALGTNPKILMLDEPAAGLNINETAILAERIKKISANGVSIMIVEHDMDMVMGLCDRLLVLDFGVKLTEGLPSQVANNPKVIEAYLGKENDEKFVN